MTRAELVKTLVLMREAGPLETDTPAYADTAGHWANGYLARFTFTSPGYPDGTFHPDAPVTRAELATFVFRSFSVSYGEAAPPVFTDVTPAHWAFRYVNPVAQLGWIRGYSDGAFRPEQNATRAEVFTTLSRIYRQLSGESLSELVKANSGLKYELTMTGYVLTALENLMPFVEAHPDRVLLSQKMEQVRSDRETAFFSTRRLKYAAAIEHQAELLALVAERYQAGTLKDRAVAGCLVELLMGMRQEADAAVSDARYMLGLNRGGPESIPPSGITPEAWGQAIEQGHSADGAFKKGLDFMAGGDLMGASDSFLAAFRDAIAVRDGLGCGFDTLTDDKDLDNDGVSDKFEAYLGSSPLSADSDADGLTDRFETDYFSLDMSPIWPDSDEDGVSDSDEDLDGDGLINWQEQELGLNPKASDTDGDGVSDSAEVSHGTNPADPGSH